MLKDLVKVKDKIKYLLQRYKQTRDSDKKLWLAYNCQFNGLKDLMTDQQYKDFKAWLLKKETPVFESLSRARRSIQQENPDLEGDKTKRLEEEAEVRNYFK